MKTSDYYALEVTNDSLKSLIKELKDELNNLDPSATGHLRFVVAKLEGLQAFIDGEVNAK